MNVAGTLGQLLLGNVFETFISTVPGGMERSVYLMSLLAITVDTAAEANYLRDLAQGLELKQAELEVLHSQLGAAAVGKS